MANKFFSFFSRESAEVKALRQRLDAVVGEAEDLKYYEAKFYDAEPSSFNGNGMNQIAGIDQTINCEQLQRLYATETWVYTAITAIAKTIAGLPVKLEKRTIVKKQVANSITGVLEMIEAEHWEDSTGSKLMDRFLYPNKFSTHAEFFMLLVIDLLSTGQFYIFLDSDVDLTTITTSDELNNSDPSSPFGRLRQIMASGKDTPIKGMYRIPPSLMKPVPSEDGLQIAGYALHAAAGAYAYGPAEIIHVKLPNPTEPLEGLSPLIPAMKPLLLDRFSTEHMIRFYKSGARLGGVIEMSKDMNKEQLGRFQRSFENNYTGRQNHHRTLILPPGMKYEQVEQNPAETALLEFCKYNRDAILAVFNVPPIKAGVMDHANYANALVQLKQFFTDTIMPYLTFLEDGFNLKNTLIPDSRTVRFKFDLSEVEALKDNYKDKAEAAKFMMDGGLTVNEVRDRVWQLGPIKDGDKCKVIENIKAGKTAESGIFGLAASREGVEEKEVGAESPEQGLLAGMSGPMVTQIMNIIGRVSRGRMAPEAGAELMHTVHGVPKATAYRLLGMKPPVPEQTMDENLMPAKEGEGAVSAPAFVPTGMAHDPGQPKKPCEKCKKEPCECDDGKGGPGSGRHPEGGTPAHQERLATAHAAVQRAQELTEEFARRIAEVNANPSDPALREGLGKLQREMNRAHREAASALAAARESDPKGVATSKPSLEEYISDALGKLDPTETVTPEFLDQLKELYAQTHGEPVTNKEGEIEVRQTYAFGMTKDQVAEHWKGFIEKTDPMIQKRHAELVTFFKKVRALVMNKLGANVKTFGLIHTRTKSDSEEILSGPEYENLVKEYAAEVAKVDAALDEAMKYGFTDTLAKFTFDIPDEKAREALKKYAASKITGIMDTTKSQISDVLNDGFEKNRPIGEISQDISNKFAEIEQGRAQVIARLETLTAVSMGREVKRQEWKEEFPEGKLMKMWISAQDDKVRDSHADLDGVSIPVDDTFDNGCRYPRDPDGDAEEVIGCRCTDITHAEEDEASVRESTEPDDSDQD